MNVEARVILYSEKKKFKHEYLNKKKSDPTATRKIT